jgi:hypothetical protein
MTDKELLELAAKAIGYRFGNSALWDGREVIEYEWNPLEDDGQAFRLAVKLNIVIWEYGQYKRAMAEVRYGKAIGEYWEIGEDIYATTRRAIVRAAAELGKDMK